MPRKANDRRGGPTRRTRHRKHQAPHARARSTRPAYLVPPARSQACAGKYRTPSTQRTHRAAPKASSRPAVASVLTAHDNISLPSFAARPASHRLSGCGTCARISIENHHHQRRRRHRAARREERISSALHHRALNAGIGEIKLTSATASIIIRASKMLLGMETANATIIIIIIKSNNK